MEYPTDQKVDKFKKHVVRDFNDYLQIVKEIKSEEPLVWFRGQSNASFRLIPNAMREMFEVEDQFSRPFTPRPLSSFSTRGNKVNFTNVKTMLDKFKEKSKNYLQINPKNDFEWSFLAQHYGVPTKLLDWTTDPLVSLFFSIPEDMSKIKITPIEDSIKEFENNSFNDLGAAVFAFNPSKINALFQGKDSELIPPFDTSDDYESIKGYIHNFEDGLHDFPICLLGSLTDKRICRQSGNFTIHGQIVWPLDFRLHVQEEIHKIFIPYKCIDEIKDWLNALDVTSESIYAQSELDIISKKINEEGRKIFLESIEDLRLFKNSNFSLTT